MSPSPAPSLGVWNCQAPAPIFFPRFKAPAQSTLKARQRSGAGPGLSDP